MRLCAFSLPDEKDGKERMGVVDREAVIEVSGEVNLAGWIRSASAGKPSLTNKEYELGEVRLLAPVSRPGKIVAAIVNTQGMLGGGDVKLGWPRLDMKAPSSVIGPGEQIVAPRGGVRPEVELAAVVGKRMRGVSPEEASEGIFGFTILNDVTSPKDSKEDAYEAYRRDGKTGEIRRTTLRGPLFRSKNHDTFCPVGPWVVSTDEVDVARPLKMVTRYDGATIQKGSTSEYIFSPWQIAAYISGFLSLEPGDLVSCGSVGWTQEALGKLDPTEFVLPVKAGTLELEVERVGTLRNPVVIERA